MPRSPGGSAAGEPPTGQGTATVPSCYRHPGRETWVRCTRCDRPICPNCMRSAAVGFQCPDCVGGAARARAPRTVVGGRIPGRQSVVTFVLIGLNVGLWLAKVAGAANTLDQQGAILPGRQSMSGEYYRLLSAMFLHVSWLHIALNMYMLYLLGPALEALLGRTRFLALYLAGGLAGSAAAYLSGQGGEGASGALFALFAAYYLLARRFGRDTAWIGTLIVLNLVLSFVVPGIGYWAHLGGLVGGAVIGAGYAYAPRGRWLVPAQLGCVVLVLAAVAVTVGARTAALGG